MGEWVLAIQRIGELADAVPGSSVVSFGRFAGIGPYSWDLISGPGLPPSASVISQASLCSLVDLAHVSTPRFRVWLLWLIELREAA